MNEEEFKARLENERPMLEALGGFVISHITHELTVKNRMNTETFLLIPPKKRIKSIESALTKAFVLKKGKYQSPYEDMTDKVGVRFVVLLTDDLKILCDVIESCEVWRYSKDRNYEDERRTDPLVFDYQSVHYVVHTASTVEHAGERIAEGTPCEIQIRTILQHAYSELTHAIIHKPKVVAEPDVHRMMARSMALIETTDEIFCKASRKIKERESRIESWGVALCKRYSELVSARLSYDSKLNDLLLDAYADQAIEDMAGELDRFLSSNNYIIQRISERARTLVLYRAPAILLIYYLVRNQRNLAREHWPLTEDELQPIYVDQGIAFEH